MRLNMIVYSYLLTSVVLNTTFSKECACAKRKTIVRTGLSVYSEKLGTLTKNSCLPFVKTTYSWGNSWTKVKFDSKDGWIKTKHLRIGECPPAPKVPASPVAQCACASTNVSIRSGAGTSNSRLGILKTGSCVPYKGNKIPAEGYNWAHVVYNGEDGFVASRYLSFGPCSKTLETRQCACGTGDVYIRSGASTSNSILGVLKVGACVPYKGNVILVRNTRWAQVDYKGQNGFVSAKYLFIRSCGDVSVNQCACGTTNVNIRAGASTGNTILGTLPNGSCVPYKGDQIPVGKYRWAHVDYKGKEGFIASNYLKFRSCGGSSRDSAGKQCVCGITSVSIRSKATITSSKLGTLDPGSCFPYKGDEVFTESLRWANVDFKGKDAYVASKYVLFRPCVVPPVSLI